MRSKAQDELVPVLLSFMEIPNRKASLRLPLSLLFFGQIRSLMKERGVVGDVKVL